MRELVLFIPHLGPGGAQGVFIRLANYFAAKGIKTTMLVLKKGAAKEGLLDPNVQYVSLDSGRMLFSLFALMKFLRKHRPPLIIATLDYASVTLLLARWLTRVKTKIVARIPIHISSNLAHSPMFNDRVAGFLQPWLFPKADAVIAVSKAIVSDLMERAPAMKPERVHVIYNPILETIPDPATFQKPDHPWFDGKNRIVLAAGRMWAQKNYGFLLRSFAAANLPENVKLIILGDGPERPQLEALVNELGLQTRVSMPGFHIEPERFMAHAEVYVLSSLFEGMPNALIQAMALGCKLVSTDCPTGPAEVLNAGEFGKLVPLGNESAMAQALTAALNEPKISIPKEWIAQFTVEKAAKKYQQLLETR